MSRGMEIFVLAATGAVQAFSYFMMFRAYRLQARVLRFRLALNRIEAKKMALYLENDAADRAGMPPRNGSEAFEEIERDARLLLNLYDSGGDLPKKAGRKAK